MLKFLKKIRPSVKDQLIQSLDGFELPSFPSLAQEVLAMTRDDTVGNVEITEVLERDPGLTVEVLKTVNSASFGMRCRVDSLNQAIGLLGRSSLEGIVVAVAVGRAVPKPKHPSFDLDAFWRNAAVRANTAKTLAKRLHPATTFESYTAALLQDMALPFLVDKKEGYAQALQRWGGDEHKLVDIEQHEFGWDHAMVAAWICEHWALPQTISAAITGHHGHEVEGFKPLVASESVAVLEDGHPDGRLRRFSAVLGAHGVSENDANDILETATLESGTLSTLMK